MNVKDREYPPIETPIEAGAVAAFAEAIGADPAAGVPPTFAAVYGLLATARQMFDDPDAAIDFAMLVHAEQDFAWDRHPEVGETVTARGRVAEDQDRRGLRLVTYETSCSIAGEPLLTSRMVDVIRST